MTGFNNRIDHIPFPKEGESLQADTVQQILRSSPAPVPRPPVNEQSMADITNQSQLHGQVLANSVLYCTATEGQGNLWSTSKRIGSQAFCTEGNADYLTAGTVKYIPGTSEPYGQSGGAVDGSPYGRSVLNSTTVVEDFGHRRMVPVKAMVPGAKYVLRAQNDKMTEGQGCLWDGVRNCLVATSDQTKMEFIVVRYQLHNSSSASPDPLLSRGRPRTIPSPIQFEIGTNPDGSMPRVVPNQWGEFFQDNVYPEGAQLPGFPAPIPINVPRNKPVPYQNPAPQGYAEVIYKPITDVANEVDTAGYANVILPISPLLTFTDVVPRPNGTRATVLDNFGYMPEHTGTDLPALTAASFIGAKCMGLVEPEGATINPVPAKFSAADHIPFLVYRTVQESEIGVSFDPSYPPDEVASKYDVQFSGWRRELEFDSGGTTNVVFSAEGTYRSQPDGELLYADPITQQVPLYIGKIKVKSVGDAPSIHTLIDSTDENGDVEKTTCGWLEYEFEDNTQTEIVYIPAFPSDKFPSGYTDVAYSSAGANLSFPGGGSLTIPPPPLLGGYGTFGDSTYDAANRRYRCTFTPIKHTFNQVTQFPFQSPVIGYDRYSVTSLTRKAHKSWYPAISLVTDRNEVLIQGERVEYELKTIELVYHVNKQNVSLPTLPDGSPNPDYIDAFVVQYVPFTYAVVIPPNKYITEVTGTPNVKIVEMAKRKPNDVELFGNPDGTIPSVLTEDDYWLTNRQYIEEFPTARQPNMLWYAAVLLTAENNRPNLREAFGAFNDCNNSANVGVFIKRDIDNIAYPNTVRLNYIPFGYAIPSKVPSCFYKATVEDNCAPRLVGQEYQIIREDRGSDTRGGLYVAGSCYVPCSSLTSLG